jgi:hypothetical protein
MIYAAFFLPKSLALSKLRQKKWRPRQILHGFFLLKAILAAYVAFEIGFHT